MMAAIEVSDPPWRVPHPVTTPCGRLSLGTGVGQHCPLTCRLLMRFRLMVLL